VGLARYLAGFWGPANSIAKRWLTLKDCLKLAKASKVKNFSEEQPWNLCSVNSAEADQALQNGLQQSIQ
jgi:hypothetical protein